MTWSQHWKFDELFRRDWFGCVSQSAGLCSSTQQTRDGSHTHWHWADRGERFWLARWKFVNSRVLLFLMLQKQGQSTCPDCTGALRPGPSLTLAEGHFQLCLMWSYIFSHVYVCRVETLIRWIHCCSTTGLAISAVRPYRPADSLRPVETSSFSHLSCLWRHTVSSQTLQSHLKSDLTHLRLLSEPRFLATVAKGLFCSSVMQLQYSSARTFHKNVKEEISGLSPSEVVFIFSTLMWGCPVVQASLGPGGKCISCKGRERAPEHASVTRYRIKEVPSI